MKNAAIGTVRRLLFYSIFVVIGYVVSLFVNRLGLPDKYLDELFKTMAFLFGAIQALTLVIIKTWSEIKIDGVRVHARDKIMSIAKRRMWYMFVRLAAGIVFSAILALSAAFVVDDTVQPVRVSPFWSAVGFSCLLLSIGCLFLSLLDYYHVTEVNMELRRRADDEARRRKELDSLSGGG